MRIKIHPDRTDHYLHLYESYPDRTCIRILGYEYPNTTTGAIEAARRVAHLQPDVNETKPQKEPAQWPQSTKNGSDSSVGTSKETSDH